MCEQECWVCLSCPSRHSESVRRIKERAVGRHSSATFPSRSTRYADGVRTANPPPGSDWNAATCSAPDKLSLPHTRVKVYEQKREKNVNPKVNAGFPGLEFSFVHWTAL